MTKIGANIRRRREELGLSQEELADRVGYKTKSAVNKIEQGVNEVRQNKIVVFANALETTPAVLMGWVKEEEGKKNDVLRDIVNKLREDEGLLSMVDKLSKLSPEKRHAVQSIIDAL